MHDDIAGIDQDPVSLPQSLDPDPAGPMTLEAGDQALGHGGDLPGGAPAGNHHVIADRRLSCQIDDRDLVGLVVVKRCRDRLDKGLRHGKLGSVVRRPVSFFGFDGVRAKFRCGNRILHGVEEHPGRRTKPGDCASSMLGKPEPGKSAGGPA